MIYRAVGWLLTAAAGLRNWMLVGCFREEKVVTGTETVGEFLGGGGVSFWHAQPVDQAGRQHAAWSC